MRFYHIVLAFLLFSKIIKAQDIPFDLNAKAYIHAAGINSPVERTAINDFVRALKYYRIWDNIHALYIPTGGTELSHKLNLKDPRDCDSAFRLFYPNGALHSGKGTDWNGINQGALTYYSPTSTRLHLMVYQDEEANESYMFSGDRNGITDFNSYTWSAIYSNGVLGFANQGNMNFENISERKGFFYGQRFHNDSTEGYINGTLQDKWYQPFSAGYNTDTSQKIWINKNNGDSVFLGTAQYQVISIGNVMESGMVDKYYEIVQAFLTDLGLQHGSPLDWPAVPQVFSPGYIHNYKWVKATNQAVDTAIDGVHLYSINDSLYLWGGWNGHWYPFNFNTGYVSGDGGHNWTKIGQACWNARHSAAYGTDNNENNYLIGSDGMSTTTDQDRKEVWKTTDGRTWILQTNDAPWSEKLILHGLAIKGDTLYIAGGQFGTTISSGLNHIVWRSTDGGVNWTAINQNASHLGGILYNNFKYSKARKKFVAFCGGAYDDDQELRTFSNQVWTSDDCITWTREKDVPFVARQYSDMVEWDDKLWVWGGGRPAETGNGNLNLKDLWYMDKNGDWHEIGNIPVTERHATGLTVDIANDRLVLVCGNMHKGAWYLEKLPMLPLFSFTGRDIFLQNNCSFTMPDFTDSLENELNGQASFVQIPSPGTIIHSSHGQTFQVEITANFINGTVQSNDFVLTAKDTTGPIFNLPVDTLAYLNVNCSFVVPDLTNVNMSDNCGNVTATQSPLPGTILFSSHDQAHEVIITAADDHGNVSIRNLVIKAKDTIAPVFGSINPIIKVTEPGEDSVDINILTPGTSDNCDSTIVNGSRSDNLGLSSPFSIGFITITWEAIDEGGNSKIANQSVHVINGSGVLPVIFMNLKAYQYQGGVNVEWSNMTEDIIDYYNVERSVDGLGFISIGRLAPKLNNGNKADYIFHDVSPRAGMKFYRIKAVELNNKSIYSNIVKVNLSQNSIPGVKIYPNPVTGKIISLQMTNLEKNNYELKIYDAVGRQVYTKQIIHAGGSATEIIQLSEYIKPGLYEFVISHSDKFFRQLVIVQ